MKDERGLKIHFCDGSSLSVSFPRQTQNEAAAQLKLDDVLERRQILLEVEGALIVIPFENMKYFQLYPAPAVVRGHTYITGARVTGEGEGPA